jgi:hypothetical protein
MNCQHIATECGRNMQTSALILFLRLFRCIFKVQNRDWQNSNLFQDFFDDKIRSGIYFNRNGFISRGLFKCVELGIEQ